MKYELVSVLGKGSSSRVFLARRYAVSEDSNNLGVEGEEKDGWMEVVVLKEREAGTEAMAEAKLLRSLRKHPCIIHFEDAFWVHGLDKICIVMEHANRDLKQVLDSCAKNNEIVPCNVAYRWIAQVTLGLAYLHSRGIVHRDIKPANLLELSDGRLVLGDLGTAKDNVFEEEYGSDTMLGTPFYLSPEVLAGSSYGTKADVWSLGCVAFEIATSGKHRAFKAKDLVELQRCVFAGEVQWSKMWLDHKGMADITIHPCLTCDSSSRISTDELLRLPPVIRAIGGLVADFRQGDFVLNRSRADCLFHQLADLGLRETILAGLQLGVKRKFLANENEP